MPALLRVSKPTPKPKQRVQRRNKPDGLSRSRVEKIIRKTTRGKRVSREFVIAMTAFADIFADQIIEHMDKEVQKEKTNTAFRRNISSALSSTPLSKEFVPEIHIPRTYNTFLVSDAIIKTASKRKKSK